MYTLKTNINKISILYDIENREKNEAPSQKWLESALENAWKRPEILGKELEKTSLGTKAQLDNLSRDSAWCKALENVMLQSQIKTIDEIYAMSPDQQKWVVDWATDIANNMRKNPDSYQKQPEGIASQQKEINEPKVENSYEYANQSPGYSTIYKREQPQRTQNTNNSIGSNGNRLSGQQLLDRNGNNIGTNGWNGLDFRKTYSQSGANTLKDSSGNTMATWANIDIGNGYKINIVDVQRWAYRFEWETVKDARWNTLPINKTDFNNLTKNIRRL